MRGSAVYEKKHRISVCVCLLLQYLLQSCSRGRGGIVEDMCYERRRAEACVDWSAHHALVNGGEGRLSRSRCETFRGRRRPGGGSPA
jgi:hypothetical protein